MNIIVMGPQGSGKSTQAQKLAIDFGLIYISSGEVLRELARSGDQQGLKAQSYTIKGELVPEELMNDILFKLIRTAKEGHGFVFDGYPRMLGQVTFLEKDILSGQKIDLVFYINLDKKESLLRLEKRQAIEHRLDETPAAIERRLQAYYKETQPVLDYFRARGILQEIDGRDTIDEVYAAIKKYVYLKDPKRD